MRCSRCGQKECPFVQHFPDDEGEDPVRDTYWNVAVIIALLVIATYMVGGFE